MKGGPKGDQKGIKKGTQNSSCSKIEKRLHVEISQKLNIDEEKTVCLFFCFHFKQTDVSLNNNF